VGLKIDITLDQNDLKHFQLIMEQARSAHAHVSPEDVVASAERLIAAVRESGASAFVLERLELLEELIAMLSDVDWRLPSKDADRVFNALAYFSEPEDLIPDTIPGLGYLDDAIMIELVAREMAHEIEAYRDFCDFRAEQTLAGGKAGREDWLAAHREELQSRMHRRRKTSPAGIARRLFGKSAG
jgi:uncharacterized membrane protein YkvA (DUF1232 family)